MKILLTLFLLSLPVLFNASEKFPEVTVSFSFKIDKVNNELTITNTIYTDIHQIIRLYADQSNNGIYITDEVWIVILSPIMTILMVCSLAGIGLIIAATAAKQL